MAIAKVPGEVLLDDMCIESIVQSVIVVTFRACISNSIPSKTSSTVVILESESIAVINCQTSIYVRHQYTITVR